MTNTGAVVDAVGPGRGGHMSQQRKRDAVLRLLCGEDFVAVDPAPDRLATIAHDRGDLVHRYPPVPRAWSWRSCAAAAAPAALPVAGTRRGRDRAVRNRGSPVQ
ncbi:hypothetical protein EU555_35275 [Methylobacterium nonmethylotrophicum]|uniref:Uncharacterized protein n=1 Tax=Methylobacterium nonmethylotrophicum TaxID=1141884 RepID=A0A4Z0NCJ4_9HYPH|nr:hypothetical protein EU555_35275 [Methylobacterium nonmethylotrophicum]